MANGTSQGLSPTQPSLTWPFPEVQDQVCQAYLGHQDAYNNAQLVEGSKGSTEAGGWDLTDIHGYKASAETTEEANNEAPNDQHLHWLRSLG